jgi:hypothetical protein
MKIKLIAPASDFASTKYTPSQRPLHHFCCERARATLWQPSCFWTGWTKILWADLTRSACVFAIVATRRRSYTPEKLLLSSLLSAKYVSWSNKYFFHGLPSKVWKLLYFYLPTFFVKLRHVTCGRLKYNAREKDWRAYQKLEVIPQWNYLDGTTCSRLKIDFWRTIFCGYIGRNYSTIIN